MATSRNQYKNLGPDQNVSRDSDEGPGWKRDPGEAARNDRTESDVITRMLANIPSTGEDLGASMDNAEQKAQREDNVRIVKS